MSSNGYQLPWIPYSKLRELYRTAQTLTLEEDAGVDAKWVWTMLVRQEVDRLNIEALREDLHFAAVQTGVEARACPLCTYENGKFIKHCSLHEQIHEATETIYFFMKVLGIEFISNNHTTLTKIEWEKSYIGRYYPLADVIAQNQKLMNTIANYVHTDWPEWKEMQPSWPTRKKEAVT